MVREPVENVRGVHAHHYPDLVKETLDELKRRKIKIKKGDIIKSRFSDGEHTEWMWIRVIERVGDRILGKLDNMPVLVKGVEYGQIVHIDPNLICGYSNKDGSIEINPLLRDISRAEDV